METDTIGDDSSPYETLSPEVIIPVEFSIITKKFNSFYAA